MTSIILVTNNQWLIIVFSTYKRLQTFTTASKRFTTE